MKITETHKWHIAGYITNAAPVVPHPQANASYFAEREAQRRREKAEAAISNNTILRVKEQRVKVPVTNTQLLTHLLGMTALSAGVFLTLSGVLGGGGDA